MRMKYKYQIAIIGAGQLGTRHLQGLVRLNIPCEISIVDPSVKAFALARERVDNVIEGASHSLNYYHNIESLSGNLDYVVVATTADKRLKVMDELFIGRHIKNILLEKVLFQRAGDYLAAKKLIIKSKCSAWVSCFRRATTIYQKIRAFFAGDILEHVDVFGGNWGLGCNSIHFIDIAAYIAGGKPHSLCTRRLDSDIIESKRAGFIEFTGTLLGRCGCASFSLTALKNSQATVLISMRGAKRSCIIDESNGIAFLCDPAGRGWQKVKFKTPVLSDLVTGVTKSILQTGNCELTPFNQSISYHLPLVHAFSSHVKKYSDDPNYLLPIT